MIGRAIFILIAACLVLALVLLVIAGVHTARAGCAGIVITRQPNATGTVTLKVRRGNGQICESVPLPFGTVCEIGDRYPQCRG